MWCSLCGRGGRTAQCPAATTQRRLAGHLVGPTCDRTTAVSAAVGVVEAAPVVRDCASVMAQCERRVIAAYRIAKHRHRRRPRALRG